MRVYLKSVLSDCKKKLGLVTIKIILIVNFSKIND